MTRPDPPQPRGQTKVQFAKAFVARTRLVREASGYSIEDMTRALRIPRNTYLKYEARSPLPHHLVPRFCELTHCSVWYLFSGLPDSRNPIRSSPAGPVLA